MCGVSHHKEYDEYDEDDVICRDSTSHDVCNKPRNGYVLGNLALERHGDHGKCSSRMIH